MPVGRSGEIPACIPDSIPRRQFHLKRRPTPQPSRAHAPPATSQTPIIGGAGIMVVMPMKIIISSSRAPAF
jgi:hypothetical protein